MRRGHQNSAVESFNSRKPNFGFLEDRFRTASAASNDCLWEWDVRSGDIQRSDAMATRFGYSPNAIGANACWWRDRIHPEDRERASRSIDQAIADSKASSWTCEYRFERRDGSYAEVCDRAYILRDRTGRALRVVGAVMDLTEIKAAYRALEESEERYRYTIEVTGQIAWTAPRDGQLIQFDERWSVLTGLPSEVTSSEWERIAHPDDFSTALEQWGHSIETGEPLDFEHRLRMQDGSFRWFRSRAAAHKDDLGHVERWYGTIEDIHGRKSSQLALDRLANFDELTSLGNRHKFSVDLETALRLGTAEEVGLLLLDIDDFKSVNDLFGHDAGDFLLMSLASRMLQTGLELYRTGGDEFAVIVQGDDVAAAMSSVADHIHTALERPFQLGDAVIDCRASIGCAVFPTHGNNASEMLKSADIALYAAKAAGRGQTRVFASKMRIELQKRNSMLEVARRALAADEISAFLQPKVSFRNGQLVGFEALMRVQNERFGPQQPAVIAAAFDHPELAVEIADRVLREVMSIVKRWRTRGYCFGRVAINASPLEFREGNYAERLLSNLESEGVPPECVEVEVTEMVFLGRDEHQILASLRQLKTAGITIALDDFGTGFASLSHLRQYPVDVLKIDQSFVRDLGADSRQQQITKAVVNLSRTMGIQTVAEGVETEEQADLLHSFGCDIGQGFLFGRALPAADAEQLLRSSDRILRAEIADELRSG